MRAAYIDKPFSIRFIDNAPGRVVYGKCCGLARHGS